MGSAFPRHHIPQEYDGLAPVDARGSWNLQQLNAQQIPDYKGSFLNGLVPFKNFILEGLATVDVRSIPLVGQSYNYSGNATLDMQEIAKQAYPYAVT